jgi:hypothetical protein
MSTTDVVNTFLERLGHGDAEGVGELFAEEIDWYVPGHEQLPWTGRRSRRADVPEYLVTMWGHFEPGASSAELDHIVVDGDDAVVFSTFQHTVKANGRTFSTPVAMRLRVDDSSIVKMHLFEDTAVVAGAFFPEDES